MMRTGLIVPAAFAGLMMAGLVSGTAHAAGNGEGNREAAFASSMKVSLTQAIATAEQHTGGKAFDAGVDGEDGKSRIVVETTGPKGVQTVFIDGANGMVVGGHAGAEAD